MHVTQYTSWLLFELTSRKRRNAAEQEAIDLLTLLIEQYENEKYPVPDAEPADVLRFLLEQNGLSQKDLVPELGAESTVSLVLAGKRKLTGDHIARLSKRFSVSPAVFFQS
ncbi:helix-turn-helix domain-containing protein [Occallatibacter riparius]|uniref:Helix-turn-helix domain-containing protein n=1 Tax=Occallatibacter riparius TaxID=1002689 RepID=A0A9J7BIM7_9BACT|nr:helix-turn-helix domain-containing protein [Occallatibacter riparius]UWZ82347.1 helix-turn-helix domain-containing protein [Occallatibacter riparius]